MMIENFTILSYTFDTLENKFITHLKSNNAIYNDKELTIKIYDAVFNLRSCVLSMKMTKDSIYWLGTSLLPFSKNIKISIYCGEDLIYTKIIKLFDEPDYDILNKIPCCFNYRNYDVDASSIYDVFCRKDYDQSIRVEKGDVVVDIGSNIGAFIYDSIYKCASKIYSCEPENNCYAILTDLFKYYPHIVLNNAAISNESTVKTLMILGKTNGGNFISDNENISWHDREKESQNVKTYTFLDFIKINDIKYIDFLKCDCEGGEHYIFTEENKEYITQKVKKIALEYHGPYEKIISFFETNNFTILKFDKYDNIGIIHAINNSDIIK